MKTKNNFYGLMLGLVVLAGGVSVTHAADPIVNIDFQSGVNTYIGVGVLGSVSDTIWNNIGPGGGTNLNYADGSGPSGVSIATTYTSTFANGSQVNPLLFDWVYTTNPQETIVISGLAPNSAFDIAFYDGFYWQDFTVPAQPGLIAQVRPNFHLGSAGAPPFPIDTYGILHGVISNASGQITILDTSVSGGPAGQASTIAGMQILLTGPTNAPPTADFAFDQLSNIGNTALLRLDGTGSFDPDAGDVLTFQWAVDGMADCVGNLALCGVIDIPLSFGAHDVTLTVTDPEGASDETTKTVTLNPAELAVLEIDKSKVKFTKNSYVKFHGEIGLPFGEDYATLLAEAVADIYVAGIEILPPTTVAFMPEVGADEWEYEGNEATNGISKFKIDWKGARYRFKESHYPIKMKSHIIAPTETVLTIKYKMKDIGGAFPIDIDGRALIDVDAFGVATTVTLGVLIEVEKEGKEITLTLPFPLLDTSIITIGTLGDNVYRVLNVVEGLKGSIGRFKLEANFDASPFLDGAATLPRTLDLYIAVGAQRYFGSASLGESELSVKKDKWRSK